MATLFLDPASAFQLSVMFINPTEAGAFKVTRRHVFFQTNCNLEVSHTRMGFYPPGGSDAITITAAACFSWHAKSDDSWIKITGSASGGGSGAVAYSVSNNWRAIPRQGSLTIAEETVKVYQQAGQTTCYQPSVKLGESAYDSLKIGYNHASGGDTIQCQYAELAKNIDFNRDVQVTLVGRFNCDYSDNPDRTTVQGQKAFALVEQHIGLAAGPVCPYYVEIHRTSKGAFF